MCVSMHVCVQVLELRLKAETGLRQLKSAEAELFRKKASLDELTVQLSLSAASLESALEEGAALEAEVAASKQQAAEANTRLEAALVETRELKVGGAKLHRPMVCDVFNSVCVCVRASGGAAAGGGGGTEVECERASCEIGEGGACAGPQRPRCRKGTHRIHEVRAVRHCVHVPVKLLCCPGLLQRSRRGVCQSCVSGSARWSHSLRLPHRGRRTGGRRRG